MRPAILAGLAILTMSLLLAAKEPPGKQPSHGDIIKEMLATMEKMTVSLGTIKDEETAQAARPELRKAALQWQETRRKAGKIKPPSKEEKDRLQKEYRDKIEAAHKKLFFEIGRVRQVPGGPKALEEIQAVLEKKAK